MWDAPCIKEGCGIVGPHTHLDAPGLQPGVELKTGNEVNVVPAPRRGGYRVSGVSYPEYSDAIDAEVDEAKEEKTRGVDPSGLITLVAILLRRDIITTDPMDAEECCGIPRDDDGFCVHRPGHPIYARINL